MMLSLLTDLKCLSTYTLDDLKLKYDNVITKLTDEYDRERAERVVDYNYEALKREIVTLKERLADVNHKYATLEMDYKNQEDWATEFYPKLQVLVKEKRKLQDENDELQDAKRKLQKLTQLSSAPQLCSSSSSSSQVTQLSSSSSSSSSQVSQQAVQSSLHIRSKPPGKNRRTVELLQNGIVILLESGEFNMLLSRSNKKRGISFRIFHVSEPTLDITKKTRGVTFEGFPGDRVVTIDSFRIRSIYQRLGYGSALLQLICEWYRRCGTKLVVITSPTSAGRVFYQYNLFYYVDWKDLHLTLQVCLL